MNIGQAYCNINSLTCYPTFFLAKFIQMTLMILHKLPSPNVPNVTRKSVSLTQPAQDFSPPVILVALVACTMSMSAHVQHGEGSTHAMTASLSTQIQTLRE